MKDKMKIWLLIAVFYLVAAIIAGVIFFTGKNDNRENDTWIEEQESFENTVVPGDDYGAVLEKDAEELFEVSDNVMVSDEASEGTASGDLISEDIVSGDTVSEDSGADASISDDSISDDSVSENAVSEDLVSEDLVSENLVSENTESGESVSENSSEDDSDTGEEEAAKDEAAHSGKYYTFVVNNPTLSLNVRSKPSRNASKVGEFINGTPGYVLQYGSEFSLITNGVVTGYALTKYLVLTEIPEAAFPAAFR